MVDGRLYRAGRHVGRGLYDTQVTGCEPWYQYPVILQTCRFDNRTHMRLVGLVAE